MTNPAHGSQKARDTLTYLRDRITDGTWPVGERIPKEPELMELIGTGRSTVREAVRSLANLGMLETVPGVGTFVRARTPVSSVLAHVLAAHDFEEVLVYRRSLEIEAAQHAAVNRTEEQLARLRAVHEKRGGIVEVPSEFHHLIVEASGSTLLLALYDGVTAVLEQAHSKGKIYTSVDQETIERDHAAVLQAIEDQDVRNAAHSMALHVDRDIALQSDMLDLQPHTERATTLIEAGFDSV